MVQKTLSKVAVVVASILLPALSLSGIASADTSPSGFSVLVTPSPIVDTVSPGQTTTLQLKILNDGLSSESLTISPKSFSVNNTTGQVNINNQAPPEVASWLTFSNPTFTIANGQWFTENIKLSVPKNAGFSYYFALNIAKNGTTTGPGRIIKASVDDFVLLNVNRPGAKASLSLLSFKASKHVYQWLPASFSLRLKNTGNTIIQPSGNIFIKRSAGSKSSIDVLSINNAGGYILPGTDRIFSNNWAQGFPEYITTTTASGSNRTHLSWTLSKGSSFRFGKYDASLVALYNNGSTDVPLTAAVSFWVLPWVFMLIILFVVIIFAYGFYTLGRQVVKTTRKNKAKKTATTP